MKNEFTLAFNEVLEDKQLPREVVLEAIQSAMVSAYRRAVNASNAQQIEAIVDPETGKVQIFAEKEVVEKVEDDRTEVSLEAAREVDPEAEIGSMVVVETTPANFGRVAAQTARQVIQQRIREAERDKQHKYFSSQIDEIVSGVIQAINPNQITLGLDLKAEGIIPRSQMIPGERFRVHERVRALLLDVKTTTRDPQIILSRSHKNFLRRLLENEVPEIYHGLVEIRSIAREPGHRSKVAVSALQPGIDPVGACVGIRGVRIQAIVRELNDEKIDVIEWNPDPSIYIAKALSPARVSGVYLNDFTGSTKTATVVVPEDQLSLAIGRVGQNARLAAKLTGWRIDIKSLPEAAADAIYKLQNEPDYAPLLENEIEILPQIENILAKKAEGRPVTPEEYQVLGKFVDRIEHGYLRMLRDKRVAAEEAEQIARADIPAIAFQIPLSEFDISDRLFTVVSETGYETVGDLMLKLSIDPDSIYALNGMGPKAWAELQDAVEKLKQQAREQELAEKEAEAIKAAEAEKEEISIEAVETEGGAELEEEEAAETELQVSTEGKIEQLVETPETEGKEIPISGEAEVEGKEEKVSEFEEIFSVDLSEFDVKIQAEDEFDEEELDSKKKKKKKKKRKKYVELEYDPDEDVMLIKKKRKRADEEDWIEDW
jgi:N utilization substance protein A